MISFLFSPIAQGAPAPVCPALLLAYALIAIGLRRELAPRDGDVE